MKFKLSILLGSLFFAGQAQNYVDIANFSYTNTTSNNFENSTAHTNIEEFGLDVIFPIVINEKTVVLTGFSGNRTTLKLDANATNKALNSFSLNLGLKYMFSEKWSGTFVIIPKMASDNGAITNEDLQLGVLPLFTNTKKENLKYKYGMYVNTEKYGILIVPIIGMYYLSNNQKFEANLTLPITADINYSVFDKTSVGMKFYGLGTTYNLDEPIYNRSNAYVAKTSNELFAYLRFQLTKSIYLNTNIGYAIGRSYKVFDANDKVDFGLSSLYFGDNRVQLNENFDNGAIFKIELLYRIHFN